MVSLPFIDLQEPERADSLAREALRRYQQIRPSNHWHIAFAEGVIGKALLAQVRYAEAEPFLLAQYRGYLSYFGEDNTLTQTAAQEIAAFYTAWDKPEEAARYTAQK